MSARSVYDRTIGRRLFVRLWFHGVLLFCGVIAMTIVVRVVLSGAGGGGGDLHPPAPWILHGALLFLTSLVFSFVFVAGPLAVSIGRPIARLRALAAEVGAGNLGARAASDRRDELGDLARAFDAMAAQLQTLRAGERQLLGDVSHELRTPLARMRVVLEMAADADHDRARIARYLGEVTTDLGELEALVDDILASARFETDPARWDAARPPLRKATIAIAGPVEAAVARFRARWPERELVVEGAIEGTVEADAALVRRVVDNLLDNARAYSDAPITMRVGREARDGVRIEIEDRGIGIAEADRARVFTPFFRADGSRSRASGGVGLGLVLARRIVEAHGGTMDFASEADRGSRFWFVLPAAARADQGIGTS